MNEEFKRLILYSNTITDLILTNKIIGIYLGGSRLFYLDSPESDYDIIVITKDDSLFNYQSVKLNIPNYNIHLHINSIKQWVNTIKNPKELTSYNSNKLTYEVFYVQPSEIIYDTPSFKDLRNIISKHLTPLCILALENSYNNLYNRINYPIIKYSKIYYHYLLVYFLLETFKKTGVLHLLPQQRSVLLELKTTQIIPSIFHEILKYPYPFKYFTSMYSYEEIYKEVKKYE